MCKWRILLGFSLWALSMPAFAQRNMDLVGQLDYQASVNDVWGYVSPDSTEYALVGNSVGLSIVSLVDPSAPEEVVFVEGQSTTWRDIKTYGDFAYVVSDNTSEGILIVNLEYLPDSVQYQYFSEEIGDLGRIRRSHNIYIDEYGLAYLAGSNLGSVIVLDVKEDPWAPQFVAKTPGPYAHDVYTRDSIVYASEVYEGLLSAYDISDPDSIRLLGSTETPSQFTHNAWLSDNGRNIFTTDERANAFVASYDISDFDNIRELDRFRPAATVGEGVIPHNVHVYNDFLVISYYTDGCIIVDAAQPDNLVEVANFDTYPGASGGFSGAWGAYPFLPSGLVLVSDRQSGLFVLQPHYQRGCYISVRVLDATDNQPIFNAQVEILSDELVTPDFTDFTGEVKMGKAVPGEFAVRASHPEYFSEDVAIVFENGEIVALDILLTPKSAFTFSGRVVTAGTEEPVPHARIMVTDGFFSYSTTADDNGNYMISDVLEGTLEVFAGVWGLYTITEFEMSGPIDEDIEVDKGYYDDFTFDFGWTVSSSSDTATWVREVPNAEYLFNVLLCGPGSDVDGDFGEKAFVTGNIGGDATLDGVGLGHTILQSPVMDLSTMEDPVLKFQPWLCQLLQELVSYYVVVTNGTDSVVIDTIFNEGIEGYWQPVRKFHLRDSIDLTDSMHVSFIAQNTFAENTLKAGLDAFVIYDDQSVSTSEPVSSISFNIYPNPTGSEFYITTQADLQNLPEVLRVINTQGVLTFTGRWPSGERTHRIDVSFSPGIYVVQLLREGRVVGFAKLVII